MPPPLAAWDEPEDADDEQRRQRKVHPEDPAPAGQLEQRAAVERPEDGTGLRRSATTPKASSRARRLSTPAATASTTGTIPPAGSLHGSGGDE